MFSEPTWFNPGGGFSSDLISNSVWLDGSADFLSAELGAKTRTRAVIGCWIQKTGFTTSDATIFSKKGSAQFAIRMQDQSGKDGKISIFDYDGGAMQYSAESTTMVLRDHAFYHLMISIDTGASAGSRLKYYINGVDQTSTLTVSTDYTASDNPSITGGSGEPTQWGVGYSGTSQFIPAYLAQCFLLDDDSIQNSDVSVSDILESYEHGSSSQFGPRADSEIAALASSAGGSSFCLSFENSVLLGQDISDNSETNVARSMTGLKSDDLDVGAASLLTDGTQFGSWNAGSNLVYQNSNTATKAWWGVDFGADGVAITKAILYGNQSSDGSTAGFTSTSISNVTFTLFGSDSAQATNNNDLSGLTTVGSVVVSNTQTKGVTATISATSNTTKFRYYYVQMNTTESTRRLLGEIELYTVGNSFTATSMSAANQSTNTPSNVTATLNPLIPNASIAYSEGNTKITHTAFTQVVPATIFATAGKFYAEILIGKTGTWAGYNGVVPADDQAGPNWVYPTGDGFIWVSDGTLNHVSAYPSVTTTYGNGDRLMFGLDVDNGWLFIGKNDTWYDASGNSFTDLTDSDNAVSTALLTVSTKGWTFAPGASHVSGTTTEQIFLEASSWAYTPPTDFVSLSSANLPTPDYQGIDYFKPVLYTGNGTAIGSGGKAVTSVGFQPDAVWIKNRDATDDHALYDIVRGVTKQLESNTATAESTQSEGLTTFGSDGFTVGSLDQVNTNTEDYVSFNWLGSNSTSTTSPAGTIASTSTVASAGHFSVGTYTGQTAAGTVGHGLGGIAEMVIVWDKGADNSIAVYHAGVASDAATDYLLLNQTDAATDNATFWNDTAPTSSVFSVGTGNNTNGNTRPKSFLAFRSVAGVCKVGSYTGNSSDNGPYLSLGFKPAWWMVKETTVSDASHDWFVADSARYTFNGTTTAGGLNGGTLEANDATAEEAHNTNFTDNPAFDFLADGIKLRSNSGTINATGRTYIYIAMADIASGAGLCPIFGR